MAERVTAPAAVRVGLVAVVLFASARSVIAQSARGPEGWNDRRSLALVDQAIQRRAEQLADTGLVDYRAEARGYVTFLVSMGLGFLESPKVVKTDQLALEVYWHAPNQSKQRIVGRRDTLLFPTDIQYHRDHLGIVQNNFPDVIRIGDGDEVSDVPHPLSARGLALYDYQITGDSLRIRLPDRTIDLIEVKVRPKDDRAARIIGALYIDPTGGQVVRMAFNFTRAAFIDHELEDLAIVLENRLVAGRFWLPSRQEIEIRRAGSALEFPIRGIIRGRWEVGDYTLNLATPTQVFVGPEIVTAPPEELRRYPWKGAILDSLPADVRATVEPDIKSVLDEARGLVREQALQRAAALRPSVPRVSDIIQFNRVQGLAIGGGVAARLGSGIVLEGRVRAGLDDRDVVGSATVRWELPNGLSIGPFFQRDFRDIGDQPERSTIVNSLAAQEFGSDLSDPYRADRIGLRATIPVGGWQFAAFGAREVALPLGLHARPMTGAFAAMPYVVELEGPRVALSGYRPAADWVGSGQLTVRAEGSYVRASDARTARFLQTVFSSPPWSVRGSVQLEDRMNVGPVGVQVSEYLVGVHLSGPVLTQELAYFGGPVTAPGYPLHAIIGTSGSATRLELRLPVPFVPVPLGRFGSIPGRATLAPFVSSAMVRTGGAAVPSIRGPQFVDGVYPSVGVGLLSFFDALRFDVVRGLNHGGWMFNVDLSREIWSIM